jgi:hypothetical protein
MDPTHKIFPGEGLSISFWMNLTQRQTNASLHVVSLGTSKFSASLHINPMKNKLTLKLMFKDRPVSTTILNNAFGRKDKWVNVMLNACCAENKIKATVVFGSRIKILSHVHPEYRSDSESFAVCFGCTSDLPTAYELTTIFGFKGNSQVVCRFTVLFQASSNSIVHCYFAQSGVPETLLPIAH